MRSISEDATPVEPTPKTPKQLAAYYILAKTNRQKQEILSNLTKPNDLIKFISWVQRLS